MQLHTRALSALIVLWAFLPSSALAGERLRIEPGTKIPVRLERSVGTKDYYQWHSFV